MKSVGLITEYNPMHSGHIYHLNNSLSLSNADVSVVVMSGNFVQRGEPAIINKYLRTKMAIDSGVNIVVELPTIFSLGSAETFAKGAVTTLNHLFVSSICFGSETGSLTALDDIANILSSESTKYQLALKKELKSGLSFPEAREAAIYSLNIMDKESLHTILSSSNNILAIEYLKAIKREAFNIKPHTYKRLGMSYNSFEKDAEASHPSASFVRNYINKNDFSSLEKYLPFEVFNTLKEEMGNTTPILIKDFDKTFNEKMLSLFKSCKYDKKLVSNALLSYLGISEVIANKFANKYEKYISIEDFLKSTKDKSITHTALSRAIFNFILDIKSETKTLDTTSYDGFLVYEPMQKEEENISYIRVLGLDNIGMEYLSSIRNKVSVPIITKTAGYEDLLHHDIYAADIYNLIAFNKFGIVQPDEFTRGIYIKGKGFTGKN